MATLYSIVNWPFALIYVDDQVAFSQGQKRYRPCAGCSIVAMLQNFITEAYNSYFCQLHRVSWTCQSFARHEVLRQTTAALHSREMWRNFDLFCISVMSPFVLWDFFAQIVALLDSFLPKYQWQTFERLSNSKISAMERIQEKIAELDVSCPRRLHGPYTMNRNSCKKEIWCIFLHKQIIVPSV